MLTLMCLQSESRSFKPNRLAVAIGMSALIASSAILAGCGQPNSKAAESEEDAKVSRVAHVRTTTLQPEPFQEILAFTGEAHAVRDVYLEAEVGGLITSVEAVEGRTVSAGQVIARIQPDVYRAEAERAEAAWKLSKSEVERQRGLYGKQLASRENLERAEADFAMAESALTTAKFHLSKTEITAPFDGWLDAVWAEVGQMAGPGRPMAQLLQLDPMEIHVLVPEKDLNTVAKGQRLGVVPDRDSGKIMEGEVTFISQTADPASKTYLVKLTLSNPDFSLRNGQFVRVRLNGRRHEQALLLPQATVIDREEGHYVFVAEDGAARMRSVEPGAYDSERVMIEEGLKAGDRVIVVGHRQLADGQKIQIVD